MFQERVLDGGEIVLKIEGDVIACATTHTIELTNSVREIQCKGSGDFSSAEYGRFAWTVSTDALMNLGLGTGYVSYPTLMQWMLNKQVVQIESRYTDIDDEMVVSGDCIITSISQASPDSENATYSVSMQGRGELTIATPAILEAPVLDSATGGTGTIDLVWTDNNTTPNEVGFEVEYRLDGDPDWTVEGGIAADATTHQLTGLAAGTYDTRVRAIGDDVAVSDSPYSAVIQATVTA